MESLTKATEWKTIDLSKNELDFVGTKNAQLESSNGNLLALTLQLRDNRIVRIRQNNYGVSVEAPVTPMLTQYVVKTKAGLSATFSNEIEAQKVCSETYGAELSEIQVPIAQHKLTLDDCLILRSFTHEQN